jgi:hypothetical protein
VRHEAGPSVTITSSSISTRSRKGPFDLPDFAIIGADSRWLYLRGVENGASINQYYRIAPEGGVPQGIDLGGEGSIGAWQTPGGVFFNTQLSPGHPVNVRYVPTEGGQPVLLWSTRFDCRSAGMFADETHLYVGLQPSVFNWLLSIPLANLAL